MCAMQHCRSPCPKTITYWSRSVLVLGAISASAGDYLNRFRCFLVRRPTVLCCLCLAVSRSIQPRQVCVVPVVKQLQAEGLFRLDVTVWKFHIVDFVTKILKFAIIIRVECAPDAKKVHLCKYVLFWKYKKSNSLSDLIWEGFRIKLGACLGKGNTYWDNTSILANRTNNMSLF